jgi:F-box associated protein
MSAIQSFPRDVLIQIFYNLPASEIAMTCRQVCKDWKTATYELDLWQRIGSSIGIELSPDAIEMEVAARDWLLKRSMSISSDAKLKEILIPFFSDIQDGETRALHYCSKSNPNAFGFYIKTKNESVGQEMNEARTRKELAALCKRLKGITITGVGNGDLAAKGKESSAIGHHDERIEMKNLHHKIELCYFHQSKGIL